MKIKKKETRKDIINKIGYETFWAKNKIEIIMFCVFIILAFIYGANQKFFVPLLCGDTEKYQLVPAKDWYLLSFVLSGFTIILAMGVCFVFCIIFECVLDSIYRALIIKALTYLPTDEEDITCFSSVDDLTDEIHHIFEPLQKKCFKERLYSNFDKNMEQIYNETLYRLYCSYMNASIYLLRYGKEASPIKKITEFAEKNTVKEITRCLNFTESKSELYEDLEDALKLAKR